MPYDLAGADTATMGRSSTPSAYSRMRGAMFPRIRCSRSVEVAEICPIRANPAAFRREAVLAPIPGNQ